MKNNKLTVYGLGIIVLAILGFAFFKNSNTINNMKNNMNNNKGNTNNATSTNHPWEHFTPEMKAKRLTELTPVQIKVTQEAGTETPHTNAYDKNYEKGIYVDIVSGEPLYSSSDKFDSGTGWPSFVKPLSMDDVTLKTDNYLIYSRTEVLSKITGSHLGHVFDDGPAERGGKRYCMNSAALKFIPLSDMQAQGYEDYVQFVK